MPYRRNELFIIATGMLLVWNCTAYGEITELTSASAYAATSAPYATINFDALAPGGSSVTESSPLSIGGIEFTSSTATFSVVPPAVTSLPGDGTPFLQSGATTSPSSFQIVLPAFNSATPVTATGFYLGSGLSSPLTVSFDVMLAGGSQMDFNYTAPAASTGLSYVGFEAISPISSITVALPDSSSILDLDNLTFGVEIPEPRPFLLLLAAAGSLMLFALGRRATAPQSH